MPNDKKSKQRIPDGDPRRSDVGSSSPRKRKRMNEIDVIFMAKKKPDSGTGDKNMTKSMAKVNEKKKKHMAKLNPDLKASTGRSKNGKHPVANDLKDKKPMLEDSDQSSRRRRKTGEGFTIYSEEELGINSEDAGGTRLCPFDCDCCF